MNSRRSAHSMNYLGNLARESVRAIVLAGALGLVAAPAAMAQDRGNPRGERPQVRDLGNRVGGMGMEQVNEAEVQLLVEVLKFDEPQSMLAEELFVDLRESRAAKMVELRELMQGMRGGEGRPDREAMERIRTESERIRNEVSALEARFYEDIQLVLTPDQRNAWSGFERRRDRTRALSGIGGAVDVQTIFEAFAAKHEQALDEDALVSAKALAERYASEMDRQVAERARLLAQNRPERGGDGVDRDAMRQQFEARRAADEKIGEISTRYADSIERSLPVDVREAFRFEINRSSLGGFMRRGNIAERLESVLKNPGLGEDQQKELRAIEADMHKRMNALAREIAQTRAQAREGRGGGNARPGQRGGDQREAMEAIRQKFQDIENELSQRMRMVTGGDA